MTARWRLEWLAHRGFGVLVRESERQEDAQVTRLRSSVRGAR